MSRIIFFRCRISEAREATIRQGLTEKKPPLGAQHYFVAQREAKKCGIIFRATRPGPCRERLALTLCRKTVIHQRQQYGNDNFKEIVMGTSHRILKQRLRRAQQKQRIVSGNAHYTYYNHYFSSITSLKTCHS